MTQLQDGIALIPDVAARDEEKDSDTLQAGPIEMMAVTQGSMCF